jgi:anti-sigma regulatory factor (Ser/Thr protein kinase)
MTSPELRICMAVDAGQLEGSRERVRLFLQGHGVDEEAAHDVLLCVHEACANAIKHSLSRTDIDVELCVGPTSVSVVVADKGLGLDLDLWDPQRRPELLQADGRGFYVMACLMDELEVHLDGGTVIRMSKQLAPRPAPARQPGRARGRPAG